MKKQLLLFCLASQVATISMGANLSGSVKSSYSQTFENGSNTYRYIPLELKMTNNDQNITYFFKVRGNRQGSQPVKRNFYYENGKIDSVTLIDRNIQHYHGPHEHDMALDQHDHLFDEKDNHTHDPNHFDLLIPSYSIAKAKESSYQLKLGAIYQPNRYSFARLTYMPFTYDSDERYYENAAIIDGQYTHLFDDNFALISRPQLTTKQIYKPDILEHRLDLRYQFKKDTFLTFNMFNGMQLSYLKYGKNFLNSVELAYDYNTEKRRVHKFYEILDHEHEKIEQTRASLRLANKIIKVKEARHNDLLADFNLIFKKKDLITKGLVLENKFRVKNDNKKKFTQSELPEQTITDKNQLGYGGINTDYSKKIKIEKLNSDNKLHISNNISISYKNFLIEDYLSYEKDKTEDITDYTNKKQVKFEDVYQCAIGDKYYNSAELNEHCKNPDGSINYKLKKSRYGNSMTRISNIRPVGYKDKETKTSTGKSFNNVLSVSYTHNLGNGFKITPKLTNYYVNESTKLLYGLTYSANLNYNYRNQNTRIKTGINASYKQPIKHDGSVINDKYSIQPYFIAKYKFNKNMEAYIDSSYKWNIDNKEGKGRGITNYLNLKLGIETKW